ncbi:MAG: exostosin family protein [Cyanobacteria bacterium P01_D01_bin.50]
MTVSQSNKAFAVNLPLQYIQTIRLTHALIESDYIVHIPEEDKDKFSLLKEMFNLRYKIGVEGVPKLNSLQFNHSNPSSQIGSLQRTLIFPKGIFDYCRQLWLNERNIKICFAGLVTEKRKNTLEKWYEKSFPNSRLNLSMKEPLMVRLVNKLLKKINLPTLPKTSKKNINGIVFWSSNRGRVFPAKAWDDEYFRLLANSQFVLCPSGDYVWTYRFFESIMCGAIPIIEQYCPAYEGFRYFTMNDSISSLKWSEEDVNYNYQLCFERLTIQGEELNKEIRNNLI